MFAIKFVACPSVAALAVTESVNFVRAVSLADLCGCAACPSCTFTWTVVNWSSHWPQKTRQRNVANKMTNKNVVSRRIAALYHGRTTKSQESLDAAFPATKLNSSHIFIAINLKLCCDCVTTNFYAFYVIEF